MATQTVQNPTSADIGKSEEPPTGSTTGTANSPLIFPLVILSVVMSTLTAILVAILIGQLSDLGDQVEVVSTRTNDFISRVETASDRSSMGDMMACSTDEGRMKRTINSIITAAQKVADIDWSIDESDRDLCYMDETWRRCADRPEPFCNTGGKICQGQGAAETCVDYGTQTFATYSGFDGYSCQWVDSGWNVGCTQVDASNTTTYDDEFAVLAERCLTIDRDESTKVADSMQQVIDLLTDFSAGLSDTITPGLDDAFDTNKEVTAFFQFDWSKMAASCEKMLLHVKTIDLSDFLDEADEEELKTMAHAFARMCEKVKDGF